ncbi:hypothetical protein [Sphingomonas sp. Leaf357]|uniref:hypothetical protein n=1 Tax=Sphingomonas sp. Leaf357 TaxID=1736350 RepID=UPI0012E1B9A6|nr:hypothetical protein [Sphingomonas sp. Leaf357]
MSDASWNILLELLVASADGQPVVVKDAIAVAEGSASVGKRWVMVLHPKVSSVAEMAVAMTPKTLSNSRRRALRPSKRA